MNAHNSPLHEFYLESLPDDVVATIQVRDRWLQRLPKAASGFEFVVADLQRWQPGKPVLVAFRGGNADLHRAIDNATREITDSCSLELDFGYDDASGAYRTWSESDQEYTAEIRVSFDLSGYFSLVGTDSIDSNVGMPGGPVGGRPSQRSLNLGGFTARLPEGWEGTVRHEFMHAVGFHHAHQNMRGPCEQAFRWEDDDGYEPTRDDRGVYVQDQAGLRPGVYTFLAGAPNSWSRAKVDHNLRRMDSPDVIPGPFDRSSVMLYRFPQIFYRNPPSQCAPTGPGVSLSEDDKRGLVLLYPEMGPEVETMTQRRNELLSAVESTGASETLGLETATAKAQSACATQASKTLRRLLA